MIGFRRKGRSPAPATVSIPPQPFCSTYGHEPPSLSKPRLDATVACTKGSPAKRCIDHSLRPHRGRTLSCPRTWTCAPTFLRGVEYTHARGGNAPSPYCQRRRACHAKRLLVPAAYQKDPASCRREEDEPRARGPLTSGIVYASSEGGTDLPRPGRIRAHLLYRSAAALRLPNTRLKVESREWQDRWVRSLTARHAVPNKYRARLTESLTASQRATRWTAWKMRGNLAD